MGRKTAGRPGAPASNPRSGQHAQQATTGSDRLHRQRQQSRDDGARALRAVFSSGDNWLGLSEAERDEWRGYFDRMLEWLRHFGYTPERNPWSTLLESSRNAEHPPDEKTL